MDVPFLYSDALHTYLSHSSTLNVGVVVVGVGELCLLTRWFNDVSCTLSRFPCIALLWLANFSLFMGEPKTTRGHDANPHYSKNAFKEHDSSQNEEDYAQTLVKRFGIEISQCIVPFYWIWAARNKYEKGSRFPTCNRDMK